MDVMKVWFTRVAHEGDPAGGVIKLKRRERGVSPPAVLG